MTPAAEGGVPMRQAGLSLQDGGILGCIDAIDGDRLFGWAAPLFGPGSLGLFLKGQGLKDELTEARKHWIFEAEHSPSQSDPGGSVLKVRGLHGPDQQDAGS